MKKIILKIMLVIVPLLMLGNSLYSQLNCPPLGGGLWSSTTVTKNMGTFGSGGSVGYQYRDISGTEFEIKIDWSSLVNSSDFMSDEILKKILEQEAVLQLTDLGLSWSGHVKVYYKTECKSEVKVAIELETTLEFDCCDVGGGTASDNWFKYFYDANGVVERRLYLHKKTVVCGYKCCSRTYSVATTYDSILNRWVPGIIGTPVTSQESGCVGDTYHDCLTSPPTPIPCIDGSCD